MSPAELDALAKAGHSIDGNLCEKCWDDAGLRCRDEPSKTQYEHYQDITIEVEWGVAAPRQAGEREP